MPFMLCPPPHVLVLGVALAVAGSGCVGSSVGTSQPEPIEGTELVLENLADNVYVADLTAAKTQVGELRVAIDAFVTVAGTPDAGAKREQAREAWRRAIAAWEVVELEQVGALGVVSVVAGGESIRDEVYSWPIRSGCRVDQRTSSGAYAQADFFRANLVDVYGLDALEHLLFVDGRDNVCAPLASINTDGSWDALSDGEIELRRAQYAVVAAGEVERQLDVALSRWSNGFRASFIGSNDDAFDSPQDALNAAFAALFYIELQTKDRKLAVPAGLNIEDCPSGRCPEALELARSRHSKEAIAANLRGARRVYFGGDDESGVGFNRLVAESGRADLNDSMKAAFDRALLTANEMQTPLEDSLDASIVDALVLYDDVKGITDLLKAELTTVLNLEVPQEVDGDND